MTRERSRTPRVRGRSGPLWSSIRTEQTTRAAPANERRREHWTSTPNDRRRCVMPQSEAVVNRRSGRSQGEPHTPDLDARAARGDTGRHRELDGDDAVAALVPRIGEAYGAVLLELDR